MSNPAFMLPRVLLDKDSIDSYLRYILRVLGIVNTELINPTFDDWEKSGLATAVTQMGPECNVTCMSKDDSVADNMQMVARVQQLHVFQPEINHAARMDHKDRMLMPWMSIIQKLLRPGANHYNKVFVVLVMWTQIKGIVDPVLAVTPPDVIDIMFPAAVGIRRPCDRATMFERIARIIPTETVKTGDEETLQPYDLVRGVIADLVAATTDV